MERWRDGEMERWRDGEMERLRDGETERQRTSFPLSVSLELVDMKFYVDTDSLLSIRFRK